RHRHPVEVDRGRPLLEHRHRAPHARHLLPGGIVHVEKERVTPHHRDARTLQVPDQRLGPPRLLRRAVARRQHQHGIAGGSVRHLDRDEAVLAGRGGGDRVAVLPPLVAAVQGAGKQDKENGSHDSPSKAAKNNEPDTEFHPRSTNPGNRSTKTFPAHLSVDPDQPAIYPPAFIGRLRATSPTTTRAINRLTYSSEIKFLRTDFRDSLHPSCTCAPSFISRQCPF